jgi:histidinol-phosphatase (PHP family)
LIDYHLHVIAHGDRPMTVENILKYCEVARARGVSQMGITEHDRYLEEIDLAAFQKARELSHDVELRLGIEIDFVPGSEERMDYDATALPYDYVIGSVHKVDNEEVDRVTDQRIYDRYETYDLYAAYYANVRKAALSGRFEILGHPDLIKIFRHFPDRDITPILEETADAVAESGIVVDVNAAGLRKPIGEVYPARESLSFSPRMPTPRIRSHRATTRASRSYTRSATARLPLSGTTSGGPSHCDRRAFLERLLRKGVRSARHKARWS